VTAQPLKSGLADDRNPCFRPAQGRIFLYSTSLSESDVIESAEQLIKTLKNLVPSARRSAISWRTGRPSAKARRGRILDVCNRGATQPNGMDRLPNAG
jgi:hypothetical protein